MHECRIWKLSSRWASFNLQREKFPCLVKFSEGGGISGHILTNVLRHFDDLKLYENDRENGIIPAMLVDGHGSNFHKEVLKYICDEKHKWTVVFGAPYGTSLW